MQSTLSQSGVHRLKKLRTFGKSPPPPITFRRDPLKRAFDVAFSASVLLFSSPLLITLSLLVRCTSKGPIFYKSRRVGRGGKPIYCWKFRSMYSDADERLKTLIESNAEFKAEWNAFQKVKNDPRITPLGRFLRKTSLDELPQFWNVLKGDLSVVGPRPPTLMGPPSEYLNEIRALYGKRADTILSVRPGITGAWQISGRSQIPFEERIRMEEEYAKSRTFLKDLVLIAKTIPAVCLSRGAF